MEGAEEIDGVGDRGDPRALVGDVQVDVASVASPIVDLCPVFLPSRRSGYQGDLVTESHVSARNSRGPDPNPCSDHRSGARCGGFQTPLAVTDVNPRSSLGLYYPSPYKRFPK